MSSFTEVMKQWKRMCETFKYNSCEKCPLVALECNLRVPSEYNYFTEGQIEAIVMAWAKENPEPQYPTWGEWLVEQGILTITPSFMHNGFDYHLVTKEIEAPISEDLVQKMGIKPKETK